MSSLDRIPQSVALFLPLLTTALSVGALLWGAHRILIGRHPELGSERMFARQLVMMGLTVASVVALALALPVSESSRNQVVGLIGLVMSGVFAFSSGTIFANLMAGIMLRVTQPFRTGDFVSVGDYFGRVAERGLLDTEIQTENRELVALPNTYMIAKPVSVVRSSGAIVSVTLSLGYDVHHARVEPLLLEAATKCGLEGPFVQVLELGNYAITYKVSGMLTDIKVFLTARSNLCRCVLDTLHGHGVEIMSPAFMNQRRLPDDLRIVPTGVERESLDKVSVAERVVFDKAEQAERSEKEKQRLIASIEQHEDALKDAPDQDKERIREMIREGREQLKSLEKPSVKSTADNRLGEPDAAAEAEETGRPKSGG